MNKNKSQSVTNKSVHVRTTASISSKEKSKKSELRNYQKPTIDLDIAKGIDTLDRQGIRSLKKSLAASKEWNELQKLEFGQQNYVQEEIICEDQDFEEHSPAKRKLKNILTDEIREEIIEYPDEESPHKINPYKNAEVQKKIVYQQGKTKTYIKPRPISAVQKQQTPENRSSQVIKNSYDNPSLSFRQQKNPFKKSQASLKQEKEKQSVKISSLLRRIKHLETSQIEQLEIILQKIEKGEIESVEGSNDIIKMASPEKINYSSVQSEENIPPIMEHRSSIPTINLETESKLNDYIETESKVIEANTKNITVINNNLILEPEHKSEIKIKQQPRTKDSYVLPVSSFKQSFSKEVKIVTRKQNIFAMKILSNWGHPKMIGLTKIQLFSKNGQAVEVQESQIKNCSKRMLKLFSGSPFTINENQMWISPCPQPPAVIVIEISLNAPLGAVRIWNYNKSQIESTKGTKTVKLIMNDEKWNGDIKKGCGNQHEDYSTLIKFSLNPNATIPPVELPLLQNPSESVSIPLIHKDPSNKWLEQSLMKKQLMELSENKKSQKPQKPVQNRQSSDNRIQRSGSYQIRKSGAKSSVSNRIEIKEQKRIPNHDQPSEPRKYLQTQAEAVKKNVAESLQRVRLNLQFEQDIITRDVENKKSVKAEKKINHSRQISSRIAEQSPSTSTLKQNKKVRLQSIQDMMKNNYALNVPPLNKLQKLQKPSPIIPKPKQPQFLKQARLDPEVKQKYKLQNKFQIKQVDDVIKMVKPALIKNVSSILNQKQQDDLGQFIKELNSILPSHSPTIPELPRGTRLVFTLLSNYGDPYYVGLNRIQVFDKYGNLFDIGFGQISGSCEQSPISNLINQNIKVYDKNSLWLTELRKSNKITIDLQMETSISLIRIWNYNQSRIHNNQGVKLMSIELDSVKIFEGEIAKFTGEYNFQDCEYILFTEDKKIINSIIENDWISKIKNEVYDNQLKNTISNFVRPITTEKQEMKMKENRDTNIPSNAKKYKNTFETPILPKGKCLEILLLTTWGDKHYVGLNKLQVFDPSKSNLLSKQGAYKISAIPSSVASLPGMSKDPRTIDKLVSNDPNSMWLCPMNSDIQKLQNNINSITVKFNTNETIGMINLWNYSKTPNRGVREIMIILDDVVIYQGYVANNEEKQYTSISFTKDIGFLQQMRYQGYNEDHQEQAVGLVNQKKQVKSMPIQTYAQLERPFTSAVGK